MAITKVTNRVLADNSVSTAQLSAGAVQQSFESTSGAFNFRNKIINGGFDFWQRGITFNNVAQFAYTSDRWRREGGSGTVNITRERFTIGAAQTVATDILPDSPRFYMRCNITAAGQIRLSQPIESVFTLAGKTVTYSFWARASTATTLQDVTLVQYFDTGGSPSSLVETVGSVGVSIPTTWTKITGTVTLPSIVSKNIGTDGNGHLNFRIDFNTSFTGNIDIAQVQVEEGSIATPFEQRPIGLELSLCQRYFQIIGEFEQLAGVAATGSAAIETKRFIVRMRTTPTYTYDSRVASSAAPIPSFTPEYIKPQDNETYRFAALTNVAAAGTLGAFSIYYTNLKFSAEL